MTSNAIKLCPYCNRCFTKHRSFRLHIRACRRSTDPETSSGISLSLSANPLLSIADTSLAQRLSSNKTDFDHANSQIQPSDDVFYNAPDNSSEDVDVDETSATSFIPSQTKRISINTIDIMLHDLLLKHKANLMLYDEICNLFNSYLDSPNFDPFARLKSRKSLLMSAQKTMNTESLRPINGIVQLHDNTLVTVPVFNIKYMIKSLLTDPKLMNDQHFPNGYNVLTGEVTNEDTNNKYGEIHTGDAWIPARDRYCKNENDMPVALIVFADKSHTDLHGALSLTPIIFTLTLFNRSARNNPNFWRPIGYIPNLVYGKGTSDKTRAKDKIQDEHRCLSFIFGSLKEISKEKGFMCNVLGRTVNVQVWIHFFIGDTEGNNKLLGQYPGNKEGVKRPYRDCKCTFDDLSNPNPTCTYLTMNDWHHAKRRKELDEDNGAEFFRNISTYDIDNALHDDHLPLSDNIHGPYKMMPPELLHTSGSGLIMYMFESLRYSMGGGRDRDLIDQQHIEISQLLKRQSERDFPRGSMRNGLIDGTKCQSSERKGNLFRLLCIAHTAIGSSTLKRSLSLSESRWKLFLEFLKQYLSMEEWFHDSNEKEEVRHSREQISNVLRMLQKLFPRPTKTNGYKIPKMHGMTKMQEYIKLFGSGINFYGGPGESAHKLFIKIPGQRTQRRVNEFAKQTALQYYNMLVSRYASDECNLSTSKCEQSGYAGKSKCRERLKKDDDIHVALSGKYEFIINEEVIKTMKEKGKLNVVWAYDDRKVKEGQKYRLCRELVTVIHRKFEWYRHGTRVNGYTKATVKSHSGGDTSFYAHPSFQGHAWYDWALVHFEEQIGSGNTIESYYPSKILGFIEADDKQEAVIQCSEKPLEWKTVESKFFVAITIGTDIDVSFVTVPIDALVHPLCVLPDIGGNANTYYVVLPKRNWSRYFGDRIKYNQT
jgi:hypothetical protein